MKRENLSKANTMDSHMSNVENQIDHLKTIINEIQNGNVSISIEPEDEDITSLTVNNKEPADTSAILVFVQALEATKQQYLNKLQKEFEAL